MRQPSRLFRFLFTDGVFGSLLGLLMLALGAVAYQAMVKEANPDLDIPIATVAIEWPGAAPELVEKQVTAVLERHLKSLQDLKRMTSGSRQGFATMMVEFEADAPVDESMQALRTRVSQAAAEFPSEAKAPDVQQVSTTDLPVMTLMLHGTAGEAVLSALATDIKKDIERLRGVRNVELSGDRDPVVRIMVDPLRLNAAGLTLSDVRNAIRSASLDTPLGRYETRGVAAEMSLSGRFTSVDQLRDLPLSPSGQDYQVRLGSVADFQEGLRTATERTFVRLGDDADADGFSQGVGISVFKVPGGDTLDVVARVTAAATQTRLPPGVALDTLSDQSEQVEERLDSVFANAGEAVAAVFIVLLVMMGWKAAAVAGLAIPVTFLGSIAMVFALGLTMNEMVVVGMILALGLLVDVFILVVEGMYEGIKARGMSFPDAARFTVSSYAGAAFAGQLTTILALAPLLAMGGVAGKFIQIIPITAIVCLAAAYVVAFLWVVPMSRFAFARRGGGAAKPEAPGAADRLAAAAAARLRTLLERAVVGGKVRAASWIAGVLALFIVSLGVAGTLGLDLYPKTDGDHMAVSVELPPPTRLEEAEAVARDLGAAVADLPYLERVVLYVGRRSPEGTPSKSEQIADVRGPNVIGMTLTFVPLEARDGRLSYTYAPEIRETLAAVLADQPGASLLVSPQTGGPSPDTVEVRIAGDDLRVLRAAAADLKAAMAPIPGVADLRDTLGQRSMSIAVEPRREVLRFHGVGTQAVADELALAMNETPVAKMRRPATEDDPDILLAVAWPSRAGAPGGPSTWNEVGHIRLRDAGGERIKATALVDMRPTDAPRVIVREDGERAVTVLARPEGTTATAILTALAPAFPDLQAAHPDVTISVAGAAQESADTFESTGQLFIVTLVLMFAVLVTLFNSYRLPIVILCTVPSALIGVFLGFAAVGMPMSFPAMIGLISLLGIVVNISIVMVEAITARRREGLSLKQATAQGAAERLRPILGTTATTLAGLILLSMSSPMWQPLAYAIMFGLLSATVISLVLVPALYLFLAPKRLDEATSAAEDGAVPAAGSQPAE